MQMDEIFPYKKNFMKEFWDKNNTQLLKDMTGLCFNMKIIFSHFMICGKNGKVFTNWWMKFPTFGPTLS